MAAEQAAATPHSDADAGSITAADSPRLMCEYCGHRTRLLWNLQVHQRRHTGDLPFTCHTCQARFAARYQLTNHLERHLDAAERRLRHICTACNVGFSSYRALYHHRPLHEDAKRYKCTQCDKQFSQASGYAQHKRWHRQRIQRAADQVRVSEAQSPYPVADPGQLPCQVRVAEEQNPYPIADPGQLPCLD